MAAPSALTARSCVARQLRLSHGSTYEHTPARSRSAPLSAPRLSIGRLESPSGVPALSRSSRWLGEVTARDPSPRPLSSHLSAYMPPSCADGTSVSRRRLAHPPGPVEADGWRESWPFSELELPACPGCKPVSSV